VNSTLNKIYVSGGASADQAVAVVDGSTFAVTPVGAGSGAAVDLVTNRYWAGVGIISGATISEQPSPTMASPISR
jgi:hypothetical protein